MTQRGLLATLKAALGLGRDSTRSEGRQDLSLEGQMALFATLGLVPGRGVTVNDICAIFTRAEFEADPLFLLLVAYGSDHDGADDAHPICDRVFDFDHEAIYEPASYAEVFARFALMAGLSEQLGAVTVTQDADNGPFRITYDLNGTTRALTARMSDDWADPKVIDAFVADLQARMPSDEGLWWCDNGQSQTCVRLCHDAAARINALRPRLLTRFG